jgi:hypothetical protein
MKRSEMISLRANAIELTENYVRACFKTFMENCNEDL